MRNKIVISSSSILLSLVASFIYDKIKEIPLFSTIWNVLKWIWITVFEYEFKVWVLIFTVFTIYLIKKMVDKYSKVTEVPKFLSYKKDKLLFFNWKWEWSYNQNSQKWNVSQIKPLCPKCETTMHYYYSQTSYCYQASCPRCQYVQGRMPDQEDIEALIIDNIDRELINI